MFTRARLRLTLLYAGLLALTVALVAGAIGVLAVNDARSTDDHELMLRASALAVLVQRGPGPPMPYSDVIGANDAGNANAGTAATPSARPTPSSGYGQSGPPP